MITTLDIWQQATVTDLQNIRGGKVALVKLFNTDATKAVEQIEGWQQKHEHAMAALSMLETEITVIDRMIEAKKAEVEDKND